MTARNEKRKTREASAGTATSSGGLAAHAASRAQAFVFRFSFFAALALLAACEFNQVDVPPPRAQLVVHSVLNPALGVQWVLVERTLTGTVSIDTATSFDPTDPIRTGFGVPVTGADVTITDDAGIVRRGEEVPAGSGVYRITIPDALPIRTGDRERLRVRAPSGEEVTGETVIPDGPLRVPSVVRSTFDRERDTLQLAWPRLEGARSYALRVDSPRGPFFLFVDSTSMRLPGSLRNLFAERLPRVFVPGFEQAVTVSAVDANFFDYYRTRNDPFTGSGIINRLVGGIGLFGSVTTLDVRRLEVTAPLRAPADGTWRLAQGSAFAAELRLWVETPAVGSDPAGLSGRWQSARGDGDGFLGVLLPGSAGQPPRLQLALLSTFAANDTLAHFDGELRGDSIVGQYRLGTGRVVYLRR